MEVLIFQSLKEYLKRFPAEEAILPVAIYSPEDGNCMFYSITVAVPTQNRFYECRVYNATSIEMHKYKKSVKRPYELAIGLINQ
jgi:hypothetical protein